ncbi:hypothetical protein SAMN04488026_110210 [Aliiruegeria lutimaris]|uniref:Uncharacterized protein n=2 Tax=Aliiruegeria lutimaris TaxID=571298 RepID=A0A1G9LVR0_9RHOB|nr:hypothetical protein SAMN04488026_110210 [Aliiruegeria lutimaris]
MSSALQRTIFEAAATGAVVGPGFVVVYHGRRTDAATLANSAIAGAAVGAAAGAYVGFLQKKYSNQEDRLERVKSDLDKNAQEIQATISVMRDVVDQQQRELAELRAQAATGAGDQALAKEVAQANANLGEMQKAISGAENRQREFESTRGLVPISGGSSAIDPELQQLSNQIAAMRAIASDLAENI